MKKNYPGKTLLFALGFLLITISLKAVTCVSTGSGAWNSPGTWSCPGGPACGDSIVIQGGHTVTVTAQQDYSGCALPMQITIFGVLKFESGNKLQLPCGSKIYVMQGGSVEPGNGGGNSNYIQICDTTQWNAGQGTYTGPNCMPPDPCPIVLPVELSSFTATVNNSKVQLLWTTQSEKNSLKFDIERSRDAINFEKILSENTKSKNGNSSVPLHYKVTDEDPLENTSYYRLRQIDIDLSYQYSSIITVSVLKARNLQFVIYPNPNHGEFTADISGVENNHNVVILLSDYNGRLVYKSNFFIQESISNKLQILPDTKLINGVYTCTLLIEEIAFKVKVVVN